VRRTVQNGEIKIIVENKIMGNL
jgi:hypothetical protein